MLSFWRGVKALDRLTQLREEAQLVLRDIKTPDHEVKQRLQRLEAQLQRLEDRHSAIHARLDRIEGIR